ncbi:TolC family protein [Ilyomonas limi]|uniref:TolC family protein n=1 Tax=Ilyomonas limi TaxID=2575867 RepID=A0A4U3KYJ8_9BACT|nr:TolC family protein [Ilyomonas limi]TKK67735.1 TolC family protein [Ilyomonas limi]
MNVTLFKKITLSLLFLAAGTALFAQNTQVLSLDSAITLSLQNSNQLKGSRARIEEATAATREATERQLPDVSVSGSYLRVNSPTFDLKLKQPGSSGGIDSTGSSAKVSQAVYGIVNASLPLYSGLRIKYGIESSKYLEKAASLDADNDREEVIMNTIDAFNNLYKAKAQVRLINESLEQARQRVKDFTNLEKNGLLARNDLLKAQLQASNIELSLVDAENNAKLSNINMNLMLGLPDSTNLMPDSSSLQRGGSLMNAEDYLQLAVQNRKDYEALGYRKQAASVGIKAARGEKYPSVALTGGYIAADIPHVLALYNAVNIGIGLNYSLSSLWKTDAKVQQAKAREKELEASQDQLSDAIKLQVGKAYLNYISSVKKIDVYTVAIEQAEENYKIVKNKFDNSLATTTDLLEAEVAQLQARLNYSFAKSDAAVAYKRLLQATGTLNTTTNK